ncbi:capsule biosynthesis protein [Pseudomonas sp. GOM6]|uniref:capsule biosynthesis protein n=1 Tax=Pseudomonas sp. GOM6 TaxID=3036944 RepID=UPI002409189C|nr:capsule biosynthesis protein [Pseudomonas sp. GOM6]MDG1582591.1 capsule biosynthesis protein [Pseudomonas sp. GOM6]
MSNNLWAAKARALDHYRWALLRERYGVLGSAVRFAREALSDWWFGLRARRRLAAEVQEECCDFLLLQSAPKVIKLQRKKLLIGALRERGHALVETALEEPSVILQERRLRCPPCKVPTRYFGFAAHAQWLDERYGPRVLLNDRNGSLYSPFLRLALNARNATLVHLAHATTVEGSRRLSMNDYDYYFLFGQSSLDALKARALRFGTSTAVLAGSHMIDSTYDLAPAKPSKRALLILGVGPDKEKESGYQKAYELLRNWAAAHPDYRVLVKPHPRSQVPFWKQAASELRNLLVLPVSCSLAQALAESSLVVNIMSNAVIEAALARRPILYVNVSGESDIFEQARFFGGALMNVSCLDAGISAIEYDYERHLRQADEFAHFHLAHGSRGLAHNLELLEALLRGEPCSGEPLLAHGLTKKLHEIP